jgi:glycerol-3-phosphate acyltransferase PlsY
MNMWLGIAAIVIGYLLGSFPTAYLIGKLRKGVDVRQVGLGNMGAANVFREIGRREGIIVWAVDVAKGAGAILIAQALQVTQPWVLGAGAAALVGHSFPIYIGFRGGKGAATTMGIFLALAPVPMLITFALLSIPFLVLRRIIAAICIVAPILPFLIWKMEGSVVLAWYAAAILLFMALRNIPSPKKIRELPSQFKYHKSNDTHQGSGINL